MSRVLVSETPLSVSPTPSTSRSEEAARPCSWPMRSSFCSQHTRCGVEYAHSRASVSCGST
eukprot:4323352-Prymnesium_polylepis.1